jgi:beta-1,4-mannosyltransferase
MQRHARALAVRGEVDLVGLEGTPLAPEVEATLGLSCHRLPDRAASLSSRSSVNRFVLASVIRALGQAVRLFRLLMSLPRPDVIVVANPPAVPALAITWLVARARRSRLVIDWHDLSHTQAAVRLGESHRVVKSMARSERRWARRADAHLAASQALAAWLARECRVTAAVVYDRPLRLSERRPEPDGTAGDRLAAQLSLGDASTPVALCPTSWTADEDFDLLLESLERADRTLGRGEPRGGNPLGLPDALGPGGGNPLGLPAPAPKLAILLTGRGDLRDAFEARLARRQFTAIAVRLADVDPIDYPAVIGMARVGICLHQSSSGLDLPTALADFRGAGIPVCAFDYAPVLGEVLTSGREGVTFREPGELAAVFVSIATNNVQADSPLARSRAWLAANPVDLWDTHWRAAAWPVLSPPI